MPSVRAPLYEVAPGVRCVPLNELPRCARPPSGFVIVGPASIADLFARVNAAGVLLRLDESVQPTMYRCATVTQAELEQLRRIRNVVRRGRVKRITQTEIELEQGTLPSDSGELCVDCSADGLEKRPVARVFDGASITLQTVRSCQQVFSAALIGHVEGPTPTTRSSALDFLRGTLANGLNDLRWVQDEGISAWLDGARLNLFGPRPASLASDSAALDAMQRFGVHLSAAIANLQRLLSALDSRE